ncbi:MAG: polyribonucleotide nucleotidyltransferase [Candidatus Kapaibacterium sp.]
MIYEIEYGHGKKLSFDIARFAKQSNGSTMVRLGDTMALVATVAAENEKEGIDFMPLQVEFRERAAAAGKIPGGFFKREGRPTEKEILSARLIDRPIRPMFPKEWRVETQVVATIFCSDQEHDADTIAATGASLALLLSDIPFEEAVAEVRVARVAGEIIIDPTFSELETADYEFVVAGTKDSILMVEGECHEISEADFVEALRHASSAIRELCAGQDKILAECGIAKKKRIQDEHIMDAALVAQIEELSAAKLRELARTVLAKEERSHQTHEAKEFARKTITEKVGELQYEHIKGDVDHILYDIEKREMRNMILENNIRLDGRDSTTIRPIKCEVGVLPRVHGSALFTRGETQSLTSCTLGTKRDQQSVEGLQPETTKRFMLHYNFPPYSVGEVGRYSGTGRREIGHGNLAERALKGLIPAEADFPYALRIVSDILESNGSSSMATVCAGSLALYDAGVPLKKPVSGIAMGLIKEGDRTAILSDILGNEDHLGDMDFKVCGTRDGITACQMDMKIKGIDFTLLEKALMQARDGRMHILAKMDEAISSPKSELSPYAPRLTTVKVPVDAIGLVIGPGGKTIRQIQSDAGVEINIEEDGTVTIAALSGEASDRAKQFIMGLIAEPEEGATYTGRVTQVREGLGAIVEFMPKKEGLLHISEIDYQRVENVSDVIQVGDVFDVKLIAVKPDGKFSLSRKALLPMPEGYEERPREHFGDRGGDRGGRGGGYGDRRGGGDRHGGGDRRGGGERRDGGGRGYGGGRGR